MKPLLASAVLIVITLSLLSGRAAAGEQARPRTAGRYHAESSKNVRTERRIVLHFRSGRYAATAGGRDSYVMDRYHPEYLAKPYTNESLRRTRSLLFSR